jgi:hypothetical protein
MGTSPTMKMKTTMAPSFAPVTSITTSHSIPMVRASIDAVTTPAVDLPGNCCVNLHRLAPGSLPNGPVGKASGCSRRPWSVHGDGNVSHFYADASPRTVRTLCVVLLEHEAGAGCVIPLQMPSHPFPGSCRYYKMGPIIDNLSGYNEMSFITSWLDANSGPTVQTDIVH